MTRALIIVLCGPLVLLSFLPVLICSWAVGNPYAVRYAWTRSALVVRDLLWFARHPERNPS